MPRGPTMAGPTGPLSPWHESKELGCGLDFHYKWTNTSCKRYVVKFSTWNWCPVEFVGQLLFTTPDAAAQRNQKCVSDWKKCIYQRDLMGTCSLVTSFVHLYNADKPDRHRAHKLSVLVKQHTVIKEATSQTKTKEQAEEKYKHTVFMSWELSKAFFSMHPWQMVLCTQKVM